MRSQLYLRKRGKVWWLKLAIPRGLRHFYLSESGKPRTHVEESLKTDSLKVADRNKYARVAYWNAEFERKRTDEAGSLPSDIREAHEWRDTIRQAESDRARDIMTSVAADHAVRIEQKAGTEAAKAWYRLATTVERPTLHLAWEEWMRVCDHTAATKAKYRTAFDELLKHMERGDAMPEDVTPEVARSYVRWLNAEALSQRKGPMSHATKHGRMVALSSFWTGHLEHNEYVPKGTNPWKGQKITGARKSQDGVEGAKRPYKDAEIIAVFEGPELRESSQTTYNRRTLLEITALGFYTGARLDELCSLRIGDIERYRGGRIVHIGKSKTSAGKRSLPVTNPIPIALIDRRIGKRKDADDYLFVGLVAGGPDNKRSWQVQKALGRYRDRVGLDTEADFHSTRRNLLTLLLGFEVPMEHAATYAGHKLVGLTYGTYGRVTPEVLKKVAQKVVYPKKIETAFRKALDL